MNIIVKREGVLRFTYYIDDCYLQFCYIRERKIETFDIQMWSESGEIAEKFDWSY